MFLRLKNAFQFDGSDISDTLGTTPLDYGNGIMIWISYGDCIYVKAPIHADVNLQVFACPSRGGISLIPGNHLVSATIRNSTCGICGQYDADGYAQVHVHLNIFVFMK